MLSMKAVNCHTATNKDAKLFWSLLGQKKDGPSSNIPLDSWFDYFSGLFSYDYSDFDEFKEFYSEVENLLDNIDDS